MTVRDSDIKQLTVNWRLKPNQSGSEATHFFLGYKQNLWYCLRPQILASWYVSVLHCFHQCLMSPRYVWSPVLYLHWLDINSSRFLILWYILVKCFKWYHAFHKIFKNLPDKEQALIQIWTSFLKSRMVESFLIDNLPLFCLSFDQQFTVGAYKDFLKLVLTINLYLDCQLYSLLKCLCLCDSDCKMFSLRFTLYSFFLFIFSNTFLYLFPNLPDSLLWFCGIYT